MPKKILIAEDEDTVSRVIKMVLESAGYQVEIARDGQEAIQKIEQNQPDAVITDLSMPNIDGGQLCRIIKESPQYSKIKVVICSALNKEVAKAKLYLPADDYIVKPVDVDMLIATVKGLFSE